MEVLGRWILRLVSGWLVGWCLLGGWSAWVAGGWWLVAGWLVGWCLLGGWWLSCASRLSASDSVLEWVAGKWVLRLVSGWVAGWLVAEFCIPAVSQCSFHFYC